MISNKLRNRRLVAWAPLVFLTGTAAFAQPLKAPFPPLTEKRVYVETGVTDSFAGLESQIAKLERSSPQTYYVVVVRSSGTGTKATTDYVQELRDAWRKQTSQSGRSFDLERSVIIVAALENRQIALLPGTTLRDRFGLRSEVVRDELIQPVLGLAREQKYAQAISALLNKTNNWIAAKDRSTAAVTRLSRDRVITRRDDQSARVEACMPAVCSRIVTDAHLAGLIGELAALVWKWYQHRRTRDRLAGRLKEIRSKAVEVMDRLDGLKERLKLLPTSPGLHGADGR